STRCTSRRARAGRWSCRCAIAVIRCRVGNDSVSNLRQPLLQRARWLEVLSLDLVAQSWWSTECIPVIRIASEVNEDPPIIAMPDVFMLLASRQASAQKGDAIVFAQNCFYFSPRHVVGNASEFALHGAKADLARHKGNWGRVCPNKNCDNHQRSRPS